MNVQLCRAMVIGFAFTLGWTALCFLASSISAEAEDLSGFSVMLQRGDTFHPDAIEISPDGRWFLTARENSIYLSDVESGAVLRAIIPPVAIGRVAISRDGRDIFAQSAPDVQLKQVFGWNAETGTAISNPQVEAPATDDASWSWIDRDWSSKNGPSENIGDPKKYLIDRNIAQLVDVNRVERVEPTTARTSFRSRKQAGGMMETMLLQRIIIISSISSSTGLWQTFQGRP